MKNRLLPFGLFVLLLGCSFLLFAHVALATGPDNNPSGQTSDVRMNQIRSNQLTGVIHPQDVLAARQQLDMLYQKSTSGLGLNWLQVGPTNYAGRSRVVMFDNQDPDGLTLYTGGVTGGIWKSTNKGQTWTALNTASNQVLGVTAMAQTPDGTIYLGTGESGIIGDGFMGTGLYRSVDGMNFTAIPGTQPTFNDTLADWSFIQKLACDPASGRLFVATNAGLKYSDNGDTWTNVKTGFASDVVIGSNGTVLFVVDYHVYIAKNGDLGSVVDLSTGTATTLPSSNIGITSVAIAPSDPAIMYAAIAKESNNYGYLLGVYRSGDHGDTWSLIFPANPTVEPFGGEGYKSNSLEVFPDNPNRILLGSEAAWYGEKYQETGYYDWQQVSFGFFNPTGTFANANHHDYIFRPGHPAEFAIATDNGVSTGVFDGATFSFLTSNKNLATAQFNSVSMTRVDKWIMGGGIRVGTELFNAVKQNTNTDGYVPPTSFRTGTFCEWSQLQPDYIFFSGEDFGAAEPYVRSEDLGETAALSFLGAISSTVTDYLPSVLWESSDFAYSRDTVWVYARQGTIEADSTVIVNSMNCYRCPFEFTTPVTIPQGDSLPVLDPYHSRFFIYGTATGVPGIYMSQDAIKFYKVPVFYQVTRTTDIITCMAVSSDLNYLYAGTNNGKIYRVGNLTLALDSLSAYVNSPYSIVSNDVFEFPEMAGRYITNVAFDPNDDNHVMVTLGNYGNDHYVFVAQNALDSVPTFVSAQGDLPKMPVFDGLFELHNNGTAIIGTDLGVFSTSNIFVASPNWALDLIGMVILPVTDLEQQTWDDYRVMNHGYIAAASFGLGLFYDTTFYTPLGAEPGHGDLAALSILTLSPNPVKDMVSVTYTLTDNMQVAVQVYDLTGRLVMTSSFGNQLQGTHTSKLNLSSLPGGSYILRVNQAFGKVVKQ